MKFFVTPELALLIKTLRTQHKISAKDLANQVGKSNSYISKLESGDVKTIKKEDLTQIFTVVTEGKDFYEDVLPEAVNCLNYFLEPNYIFDQLWLLQYDVTERPVTLTPSNIQRMRQIMEEHKITSRSLLELINSNVDSEMDDSFPANEYVTMEHNGATRLIVRTVFRLEDIEDLLTLKSLDTTYYVVQVIIFNLFRLVHYPDLIGKMPSNCAAKVLQSSAMFMDELGIRSLTGFAHLISSDSYIAAATSPKKVISSLDNIIEAPLIDPMLQLLRDYAVNNPTRAARVIDIFNKNLSWDPGFMLKLMETSFYKMGDLSYSVKKRLIEEILQIVARYDEMSDFEKKIETY